MSTTNFNQSYIGPRPDILRLLPPNSKHVLDVGCSTGSLGASIKKKSGAHVVGIELSKEMGNEAINYLDKVFVGDAYEIFCNKSLDGLQFDTIIFADVLEHLINPWEVLSSAKKYLHSEGSIIASIPNVMHIDTLYNLAVRGYWPYRERGIHDKTHLRFFTLKNIRELFDNEGFQIEKIITNYRIVERISKINRYSYLFALPGIKKYFAFQYLIRAINKNCFHDKS